ncbi:MAG: hypothetical protein MJ105_02815 [Lachnospiraceae bacterium]|nr:hypothetical protein [Lachnospiraceae bacterium]
MKKKLFGILLCLAMLVVVPVTVAVATTMEAEAANNVSVGGRSVPVTSTSLNFNNATIANFETFAMELAQLPYLNRVELCNSNLTDAHMEILQTMYPNVKFVWVVHMKHWSLRTDAVAFSTQQPKEIKEMLYDADIQVLKYCTDLVALDLGHHRLTNLSVIGGLTNLRVLVLADNKYTDITPLSNLTNLMYLELFCSRVSDVTPLMFCENLLDLNISFTRVSNIRPLLYFPKLQRLWFTHTQISEADRNKLIATYPNVTMDYTSSDSISKGWRNHPRFSAMRSCYAKNAVCGEFATAQLDYNIALMKLYKSYIFDPVYYAQMNPDVFAAYGSNPDLLFYHFMVCGIWEGRPCSPTFNLGSFVATHPGCFEMYGTYLPRYYAAYILEQVAKQN